MGHGSHFNVCHNMHISQPTLTCSPTALVFMFSGQKKKKEQKLINMWVNGLNIHNAPSSSAYATSTWLRRTTDDHQLFPWQPGSECSRCSFVQYGEPYPPPVWEPAQKTKKEHFMVLLFYCKVFPAFIQLHWQLEKVKHGWKKISIQWNVINRFKN